MQYKGYELKLLEGENVHVLTDGVETTVSRTNGLVFGVTSEAGQTFATNPQEALDLHKTMIDKKGF